MKSREIDAIRSEGAELYIQSYLMLEFGIPCSMASRNMPGFDLIAHNIDKKKSVKIQVKYRRAKNNDGVKIHNFGFDFLTIVLGNLGRIGDFPGDQRDDDSSNEIYIIPRNDVEGNLLAHNRYKIHKKDRRREVFKDNWKSILKYLKIDTTVKKTAIKPWTKAELSTLKKEYPISNTKDLSKKLGRTLEAVRFQAKKHGLKKTKSYTQSLYKSARK
jgi:hypothetical protein